MGAVSGVSGIGLAMGLPGSRPAHPTVYARLPSNTRRQPVSLRAVAFPEPWEAAALPLPDVLLRSCGVPAGLELGTAVMVSVDGGTSKVDLVDEGVVIEIVPGGFLVRSSRVDKAPLRVQWHRYVVQCARSRVVRRAEALVVVA